MVRILRRQRTIDEFNFPYTLPSPYTGCAFNCIYCYSIRSSIWRVRLNNWGIEPETARPKLNAVRNLRRDLEDLSDISSIEKEVQIGNFFDPYPPIEGEERLTRRCLEVFLDYPDWKIHLETKSPIIERDIDILNRLNNFEAEITITTLSMTVHLHMRLKLIKEKEMTITDDEFNSLIGRLREYASELTEIYDIIKDRRTILGNIGEKFIGYCIFYILWKLGYPIDFHNRPHSYLLTHKFGADAEGRGGIDFKLTIVDLDERQYIFLIESKNWGHYPITPTMFRTEILSRFTRYDETRECQWTVTMNTRNIEDINSRCSEHNIHILPINHHITLENLPDTNIMRSVFDNFIDEVSSLIRELAPERSYPDIEVEQFGNNRRQNIIQDLLLGVSYPIIEHKYNRSRAYIARLASHIRSFNYPLPDRRKKNWREIWELQE